MIDETDQTEIPGRKESVEAGTGSPDETQASTPDKLSVDMSSDGDEKDNQGTPSLTDNSLHEGTPKVQNTFPSELSSIPQDQVVSWSKTLQSPTLPTFSPAIETNKSETSHFGTGLQLSINRTRQLNKTSHRCMTVLQEVISLYAQYAIALNKAGQLLPSPTEETSGAALAAGLAEPIPLIPLQKAMESWAKDKNNVATQIRGSVSPLLHYLTTHMDSTNGVQQRYKESRSTCAYARARALRTHTKYVKAIRDCEQFIAELKSKENATPSGASGEAESADATKKENATDLQAPRTPSKAPKRWETKVKEQLKESKKLEAKYKLRVKWENECVEQCQKLEAMALDTMQKMEEDRLSIFVNTMIKVLAAQKEALDGGVISLTSEIELERNQAPAGSDSEEKNPAQKFYKMLTGSNSFLSDEDSNGAMDAETLGLPEEVGHLHDRVRARLAARRERIQLSRTLSLFFESVVKAAAKLGQSLVQIMKKESPHHNDTLHVAMGACEGAHILRLWDGMTKFIESEAEGCFAMADSLRNVRAAKLDSVILYGEKAMKATSESDEAAWKQLCEAARAQSRAEFKYRQSSLESAKARERVLSLDTKSQIVPEEKEVKEKAVVGKEKAVVGKRMQKGFQNIMSQGMSLLPDGGDKAMKLLNPSARATHAQRGLKEADEKEAKERQQLVAAAEATNAALAVYKADAAHVVARYDEEEKEGWKDIKSCVETFADLAQKLLGTLQLEAISDLQPIAAQSQLGMVSDINEWRMRAQQELVAICVDCTVADDSAAGFRLEVDLPVSSEIDEYMLSSGMVVDGDAKSVDTDDDDDGDEDDGEDSKVEFTEAAPVSQPEKTDGISTNKALFRRQLLPASSQIAIGPNRANVKKLKKRETIGADHPDPGTQLFLTYFWPDPVDAKNVPSVVDSFQCSFRDGAQQLPSQYGRVFVSSTRIVFTSWTKKKLNLRWEEVRDIKASKSFDGRTDASLQVLCKRKDATEESCMVLDGFYDRSSALNIMEKLREEARVTSEEADAPARDISLDPGGVVPPDNILEQMKIVVSKQLKNITIERFYQIVWAEKDKPFFRPWVEKEAFDVEIRDWKAVRTMGPWCKEEYNEERSAKFRVKRKTHLYIGPPIANVTQTHRCRVEGNDKCVVAMTIEFDGIPYSDCFAVEVRWVARREGEKDIKLECGLAVDFRKKTFLKKQIQSGTIEESTPVYKDLFKAMQAACIAAGGMEAADEGESEVEEPKKKGISMAGVIQSFKENPNFIHVVAIVVPLVFFAFLRFYMTRSVRPPVAFDPEVVLLRVEVLTAKIDALQSSVDELLRAIKESNGECNSLN